MIKKSVGTFCTIDHMIKYGIEVGSKLKVIKEKKKNIKFKQDYYDNHKPTRTKATQRAFNRAVLRRDADLLCVSCRTRKRDIKYDAGHYKTVGAYPELRFNFDNCHKQCSKNCNVEKSGNIIRYRKRLILKIGIERLEKIEGHNEPKKYTCSELKELEKLFNTMFKD